MFPPTGGKASGVGHRHRGPSCGWTICPAPGHSAVARRGMIAMRRFGVIVALGALLGMFGGAATAAPALAGGRGDGWLFQTELGQTFNLPADFCGFPIVLKFDVNNAFGKEFTAPDGSTILLFNGSLKGTFTNPANGKSISVNVPSPTKATVSPDGMTITVVTTGPQPVFLTPADAAVLGVPPLSVVAGRITATLDADGNMISGSLVGHVLVNICTALS
jgi:hypothetical protein